METDWQQAIKDFKEVRVQREVDMDTENTGTPNVFVLVVWEYIGEGYEFDYQPDDPDDIPLLRFSVMALRPEDGTAVFTPVDDGSYCTLMWVNAPKAVLERGANVILDTVAHNIAVKSSYRRDLEYLSWMGREWYEQEDEA